jgi:glycosyltransferase involved in cell wall biosynthesis
MIKTKKVFCFILPSFFLERKGGSELQVYYIAMELIRRGWEVHYIREENTWIGKELVIDGIKLYALPARENYLCLMNNFYLKKIMKKIKADVWYCRATTNYVAPVAWSARKIGGQVAWACSNDFQVSKNLLRKAITNPLKKTFFNIFALVNRFLFSQSLKYIDHVILQSEIQNRLFNTNYNCHGTLINNAHPIPVLSKIKRKKIILWAARLHEGKHPEIFIKVAKRFKLQDYKFILAGRPMNNSIITLKEIVDAGKNLPNFDYIGEVDSEQIHSLMQQSMLFVSTSSNEGFPNTFIEAWLRGVPVVSLKVDPDSYIKKFNMGRVSENIEQMCYDIHQLMTEPELWKEISKNCLEISKMSFNIETHVDKLEHLIDSTHT